MSPCISVEFVQVYRAGYTRLVTAKVFVCHYRKLSKDIYKQHAFRFDVRFGVLCFLGSVRQISVFYPVGETRDGVFREECRHF